MQGKEEKETKRHRQHRRKRPIHDDQNDDKDKEKRPVNNNNRQVPPPTHSQQQQHHHPMQRQEKQQKPQQQPNQRRAQNNFNQQNVVHTGRQLQQPSVLPTNQRWQGENQNRNQYKNKNQYQQNNQVHYGGDSKISSADISPDVQRVWDNILKWSKQAGKSHELPIDSSKPEEVRFWNQVWIAAGSGAGSQEHVLSLPAALMKLPDLTLLFPSPDEVVRVLVVTLSLSILSNGSYGASASAQACTGVATLEIVIDVVKNRLMNHLNPTIILPSATTTLELLTKLSDLYKTAINMILSISSQDLMERLGLLLSRGRDIIQYRQEVERIMQTSQTNPTTNDAMKHESESSSWKSPTLSWLLCGDWHNVGELRSCYSSPDEYARAMESVWTLLAFYWGAAAVWPRCSHQQQGGNAVVCGEPLLATASPKAVCSFRNNGQQCGRSAVWSCHRRGHRDICSRCLQYEQAQLISPSGPHASTDIYDAVVDRETDRREGVVYMLSSVTSRRPPKIPPNWKTSYRLQPSALVGVVRLATPNQRISPSSIIQWAEIVPVNAQNGLIGDWKCRQEGRMAIRLLSRGDCAALSNDADTPLERRCHLAVIDLRVFVPEVISVLSTISSDAFASHLSQIPFAGRLIGQNDELSQYDYEALSTVSDNVSKAIERSEIDFIRRLDHSVRKNMVDQICAIPQVQTLYGTQLEAFCGALASSMHCTQGPPGTGKSYIGVCLVLALDIIRNTALKCGKSVGPILVLSYKNHALDEFLCDVLRFSHMKTGMLIRTGKAESPELSSFSEKFSPQEQSAQEELARRVSTLRSARKAVIEWRSVSSALKFTPPENYSTSFVESWLLAMYQALELVQLFPDWQSLLIMPTSKKAYESISNAIKVQDPIVMRNQSLSYTETLTMEAEHWSTKKSFLCLWLEGLNPPPRCGAMLNNGDVQCLQCTDTNWNYCNKYHRCYSRQSVAPCQEQRKHSEVPYCDQHICDISYMTNALCVAERTLYSSYCENHSCPCCLLLLSSSSKIVVGAKMPFSCAIHKCAQCPAAQLYPLKYCEAHCCEECGISGNSTNLPKVGNSKFCKDHKCVIQTCMQKRDDLQSDENPSLYCKAHSCLICRQIGKSTGVVPDSRYCESHICQHVDENIICVKRCLEQSIYCASHTCRICTASGIFPPLGPVQERKPRNVCMEHPLCCKVFRHGGLCTEVAIPPLLTYCHDHTEIEKKKEERKGKMKNLLQGDGQCHGVAKTTKQRCKAKGVSTDGGRWWCDAHLKQKEVQIGKEKAELSDDEEEIDIPDLAIDFKEPTAEDDASISDSSDDDDEGGAINPTIYKPEFVIKRCCAESNGQFCSVLKWTESIHLHEPWFCWIHSNHECQQESSIMDTESAYSNTNTILPAPTLELGEVAGDLDPSLLHLMEAVAIMEDEKRNPWESYEGAAQDDKDFQVPDFLDAAAVDMHPDELDVYNEDIDDDSQDGNDDLNRLRDMMDHESDCESEEGNPLMQLLDYKEKEGASKVDDVVAPAEWSWRLSHSERLEVAASFLYKMSTALTILRKAADDYVAEARKMKNEAGSLIFRGARVVGATVVGASRRLEAIRAAEPFAVLVEEACEVMEPTLVSVLAVKSLQKLELIGDHRQLPAFVQNCWFNLETTLPSIKTSLFERLISGRVQTRNRKRSGEEVKAEPVPFAILDEQRRMRTCIADITRPDYEDVVDIQDHPHTQKQLVGDRVRSKAEKMQLIEHRTLWPENFRGIPGVTVPLFFWNLGDNREGRPVAGLSACNPTEASAVVSLTKWLLTCGVPASCISIITPYKGQKTEIISQLRKAKCLPGFQHARHPQGNRPRKIEDTVEDVVTVSTVDRFQGDENDVIILSLVKTQSGNRFVALKNRFIVAVSRARMGFYIVGSVNAVVKDRGGSAGPEHWIRFVSGLETQKVSASTDVNASTRHHQFKKGPVQRLPASSKSNSSKGVLGSLFNYFGSSMGKSPIKDEQDDEHSDVDLDSVSSVGKESPTSSYPQVGTSFPVCCPRHFTCTTRYIDSASKFPMESNWGEFCKERCSYSIPACGHACTLLCHSPTTMPHTQQSNCQTKIDRPCELHVDVPLICCDVSVQGKGTLADTLTRFKCSVRVKYSRPECNHVVEVECHQYQGILNGAYCLPNCEVQVADFVNPTCNHISKNPSCTRRREWEKKPPQCCVSVLYKKPCGCTDKVQCWEHIKFMTMVTLPLCLHDVEKRRPRCGHILSLRCHISSTIDDLWNDHNGQSAYDTDQRKDALLLVQHGIPYGESESRLLDGHPNIRTKLPNCMVPVSYKSKCGHTVDMPCSIAFDTARGFVEEIKCNYPKELHSPFCGHNINAPCWAGSILSGMRLWQGNPFPSGATAIECAVSESQLSAVGQAINSTDSGVPMKVRKLFGKVCSRSITVVRNCGREHAMKIRCSNLLQMLLNSGPNGIISLPDCEDIVERPLICDHAALVPCYRLHDNPPPLCLTPIKSRFMFPCGLHSVMNEPCHVYAQLCNTPDLQCQFPVTANRYRCKHSVEIPCHLMLTVTQSSFGETLSSTMNQEDVVVAGREYCIEDDSVVPCSQLVSFQNQCGHAIHNIRCSLAFQWAAGSLEAPQCGIPVDISCSPLCHHFVSDVPCWLAAKLTSWKPWFVAGEEGDNEQANDTLPAEFSEIQSSSEMNQADLVVPWEFRAPNVADFIDRKLVGKYLRCTGKSVIVRPCSHILTMSCVDAFFAERPACFERVSVICEKENCQFERFYSCSALETIRASGVSDPCTNPIEKVCNICRINKKSVACSKDIVECTRRVCTTLPCGHQASWVCGTDTDPRTKDPFDCCKGCLFPLWDSMILEGKQDNPTLTKDFAVFVHNQFQSIVERKLIDMGQREVRFDRVSLLLNDLKKHVEARTRILQGFKAAMQKDTVRLSLPPPSLFDKGIGESFYDLVFKIPKSSNEALKQNFSNPSQSDYGHGAKLHLFSPDSLKMIKPSVDGELVFYMGIAFRFRVLCDARPFRIPTQNGLQNGNHAKKLREQADEMANKTLRVQRAIGFDCVDCQVVEKDGILSPTGQRLYWQSGAVIPLCKVILKLQCQCAVCMDYFPTSDGLRCNSAHFLCWGCFHDYVNNAKTPGAIGRYVDKNGNLTCPGCKKATPYTIQQISAHGGPQAAKAAEEFTNLRAQITSEQKLKEELEKQEKRIREEYERIQRIKDVDEREATKLRLDIIEQILTLRCPRCKAAFTDFSGCFALTCRCSAGFCAWCLKDCGADAHSHIPGCVENGTPGDVFGSFERFNQHHQQRRQRLVREKFHSQSREVQNHLRRLLVKDLADLKITLD